MTGPLRLIVASGLAAALFASTGARGLAGQQAGSSGATSTQPPPGATSNPQSPNAPAPNAPAQNTPAPNTPAQGAPATAQPAADPNAQQPTFRAGVNFVRVDVIVTDRTGKPVGDLKPEEFEVTEDGKPQKIETFKLISLDGGLMAGSNEAPVRIRSDADELIEARRDDVRLFGMFLDDYHVKRDSSLVMRRQLARFIETQLGPSDMIGLMSPLEALASVRFGRNHDATQRALEEFVGRKFDYRPMNSAEERYIYLMTAEQIEQIRNQVSFSAIKALIMQMGSLKEGRKALILVSEGYTNVLPPQIQNPYGNGAPGTMVASAPGAGLGDYTREFFASMDLNLDMQMIYDLANRNNVAIYTVDPRGLAASEFGVDQPTVDQRTDSRYLENTTDTLRSLADWTDGRAIVNRNDLAIAMKQIVVDSSAYYLIGYNSTIAAQDGKFHKIDVKLKRPGLQPPRHRQGYWALKPEEAAKAAASVARAAAPAAPSVVEKAMVTAVTPRSRAIRTWIGTERGENGKTRVTLVWEPMPARAGDTTRPSDRAARVMVTALSGDGSPYYRGRVPDGGAVAAASTGVGARVTFDAQPGTMQIRLSIEGADANVIDTETREVAIPDLSSPQTTFATPMLFRARTIPELQQLKAAAQPVPTANREFIRTDRLLVRATIYGPSGSTSELTAELLNRTGQRVSELPVTTAPGSTDRQVELTLANLAPGDYAIALKATSPGGDAKELVAFRILP